MVQQKVNLQVKGPILTDIYLVMDLSENYYRTNFSRHALWDPDAVLSKVLVLADEEGALGLNGTVHLHLCRGLKISIRECLSLCMFMRQTIVWHKLRRCKRLGVKFVGGDELILCCSQGGKAPTPQLFQGDTLISLSIIYLEDLRRWPSCYIKLVQTEFCLMTP